MAKLIWFVVLVISLGSVFSLKTFKKLPVNNETLKVQLDKEAAIAKAKEEARLAKIKAMEEAAKAPKKVELVLDTPELKNGYDVYHNRGKCITCHGKKGQGNKSQQAPKLAAQHDWYLYSTLVKFKTKVRVNKKMDPYLRSLSDQDFRDVGLYLSKLEAQ